MHTHTHTHILFSFGAATTRSIEHGNSLSKNVLFLVVSLFGLFVVLRAHFSSICVYIYWSHSQAKRFSAEFWDENRFADKIRFYIL